MQRLVCVSNRISLPGNGASSGGLAVGLNAAMSHTGGLWLGWSGEAVAEPAAEPRVITSGNIKYATLDLTPSQVEDYYNGYCNGSLWPLLHYNPELFKHEQRYYEAYQAVNALFARQLMGLLEPGDAIWVHDYHLIPLARYLRRHQFNGPIGFFLHTPFPHMQVLRLLPNHAELIRDLCRYDVVGFQTEDDVRSFRSCFEAGVPAGTRVGAYPIGIDVDAVAREAQSAVNEDVIARMKASLLGRKLIIGVDRLDYSKGLPERFAAFDHFLETFPDNLGNVTFLQIAPLSRADVLAYSEIRQTLEQSAGRINGKYAEADWTPIRYLNRNFSHETTMGFLRAAQVGLVTPLRDGMNLVAKEFIAAQDPKDPGVLILSPMAGAARELTGALKVNPYDKRGMAVALQDGLHMPLEERRRRYQQMMETLRDKDIHHWYGSFCSDLDRVTTTRGREVKLTIAAESPDVQEQGWWRRTVGRLFSSRVSS
ncbi:MAG TPA: trehalose-6-phosphate synthase [Steroidobacteraceae bacterium]|nr:trehalose-6-phosphate synthase [Steroidobacteraceae bacterium]